MKAKQGRWEQAQISQGSPPLNSSDEAKLLLVSVDITVYPSFSELHGRFSADSLHSTASSEAEVVFWMRTRNVHIICLFA